MSSAAPALAREPAAPTVVGDESPLERRRNTERKLLQAGFPRELAAAYGVLYEFQSEQIEAGVAYGWPAPVIHALMLRSVSELGEDAYMAGVEALRQAGADETVVEAFLTILDFEQKRFRRRSRREKRRLWRTFVQWHFRNLSRDVARPAPARRVFVRPRAWRRRARTGTSLGSKDPPPDEPDPFAFPLARPGGPVVVVEETA